MPLAPGPERVALVGTYFAPFEAWRQKLLCSLFTRSTLGCPRHRDSLCMASDHSHVFRLLIQSKKLARSHRVNLGGLVSLCSVEVCLWRNSNGKGELHPFSTGKEKQLYSACSARALVCKVGFLGAFFPPLDATLNLMSLFLVPLAGWGCDRCHELLLLC